MSCSRNLRLLLTAFLVVLGTTGSAHAAGATRTWVSGVGDDANPCSRTAPCKTFAGAISKTENGGEISVLDSGGFGAVTVTKSVTIDGAGVLAGVLNSGTNGFIINAPGDDVVLRNVSIQSAETGVGPCLWAGLSGVRVLAAASVRLEHVKINGQSAHGVLIDAATPVNVSLDDVDIANACGSAINAVPTGGAAANVFARGLAVTNSGTAVTATAGAHVWLDDSTIFGNALDFAASGGGLIETSFDTSVFANTTHAAPSAVFAMPPAGATGPTGPSGPTGPTAVALVVASPSLTAKVGKAVALRFGLSKGAATTLTIKRGTTTLGTIKAKGHGGANVLTWTGKIKGKFVAAGTYRLVLSATGADGVTVTDATVLKVKK